MTRTRITLSLIVALPLLWLVAFVAAQWRYEARIEGLAGRFGEVSFSPRATSNASAVGVEAAATQMGLALDRRRVNREFTLSDRRLIREYLESQLEPTSLVPIDRPPVEVSEFLARNSAHLAAMDAALEQEAPRWKSSLDAAGEVYQLSNHLTVARIYAVRSLEAAAARDWEKAWWMLERASMLADSLFERPELVSNMVALNELRLVASVAMLLPPPTPSWYDEAMRRDLVSEVREAMRTDVEGMQPLEYLESQRSRTTLAATAALVVSTPLVFWKAADSIDAALKVDLGGCEAGAVKLERGLESLPTRVEIARHDLALSRLVQSARSGETLEPEMICGRGWVVVEDSDGGRVARFVGRLPESEVLLGPGARTLFHLPADEPAGAP